MIKEKQTYSIQGQNTQLTAGTISASAAEAIAITKAAIEQQLAQNGIAAAVTEDVFSYKTGMFKNGEAQCLVISNSAAPNDFRKLVLIVMGTEFGSALNLAWYGESKIDALCKKANKIAKKEEKNNRKLDKNMSSEYGTLSTSFALAGKGLFQRLRLKSISKKIDALSSTENDYHNSILYAVSTACGSMRASA
ncbi:MAG: hypothetical protein IJ746_06925 [Ruminococcus sp.]|nr:hypothetical protein [Ruminococcus sp.]